MPKLKTLLTHLILVSIGIVFIVDNLRVRHCNFENVDTRPILATNNIALSNQMNINSGSIHKHIVQSDNTLYVYFWLCKSLTAINLNTAEIISNRTLAPLFLDYDSEHDLLYMLRNTRNAQSITAFSPELELDDTLWVNQISNNTRNTLLWYFDPEGEDYVYATSYGFRSIDPLTGELGEAMSFSQDNLRRYYHSGYFWRLYSGRLEAYAFDNLAWVSDYDELLWSLTQIWANDEVIVLRVNGAISVLSRNEGDLLWHYNDTEIISNIQALDNQIYAFDIDANLLRFEMMTGTITGNVVFEPPSERARDTRPNPNVIGSSQILVNEEFLTIFFGDTNMLSTFRFSD